MCILVFLLDVNPISVPGLKSIYYSSEKKLILPFSLPRLAFNLISANTLGVDSDMSSSIVVKIHYDV